MALSGDERLEVETLIKRRASETTQQVTIADLVSSIATAQAKADAAVPASTYSTNRASDQAATATAQTAANSAQSTANAALPSATYATNRTTDQAATAAALAAAQAAQATANNASTSANPTFTGNVKLPHLLGTTAKPTIAAGVGAGTSPASVVVDDISTDLAGEFSFTTGTAPTTGTIVTITFNVAYQVNRPVVILTGNNTGAQNSNQLWTLGTVSLTGFTVVNTASNTIPASTGFKFAYITIGK